MPFHGICFVRSWLLVWKIKNSALFLSKRDDTLLPSREGFQSLHTFLSVTLMSKNFCLPKDLPFMPYSLSFKHYKRLRHAEVSHYFMDTLKVFTEILCALRKVTPSSFHVVLCPQTAFLGSICTLLFYS